MWLQLFKRTSLVPHYCMVNFFQRSLAIQFSMKLKSISIHYLNQHFKYMTTLMRHLPQNLKSEKGFSPKTHVCFFFFFFFLLLLILKFIWLQHCLPRSLVLFYVQSQWNNCFLTVGLFSFPPPQCQKNFHFYYYFIDLTITGFFLGS